tara:strand:+ start:73 stop:1104 length:1032 start_codon:yes stop_codon:yes gene_type:complete
MKKIIIGNREISENKKPLIIPEIGINHEGNLKKAKRMIKDAHDVGAECVKFQSHVIEDEMIYNEVIPGNSDETIWNIMKRCALSEKEELELKKYTEELGLIYISTPFSREAADRLNRIGVDCFKIGSGECNNYPLLKHIVKFGKPIILSTGMNNISSISKSVNILKNGKISFAILHATSIYPTPYEKVRLEAINELKKEFPNIPIGLSDHSLGNYACFAAIAMGATILEKHFTSDKSWKGPDISLSITPNELKDLIDGSNAIYESMGGTKDILDEESPTINFAYSSVVSIKDINIGEKFSMENIWVKRPGTGKIRAEEFEKILNKKAKNKIPKNVQLTWDMIE